MIKNAKNTKINEVSPNVPWMGDTIAEWMQKIIFNVITKSTVNFETVETAYDVKFMGVWQPFTFEQLTMKPADQRSWSWFMVHSQIQLPLKTDDVVKYRGVQYRVMGKGNYSEYGYFEYHVVQDSSGAGPEILVPEPIPDPPVVPDPPEEDPWF